MPLGIICKFAVGDSVWVVKCTSETQKCLHCGNIITRRHFIADSVIVHSVVVEAHQTTQEVGYFFENDIENRYTPEHLVFDTKDEAIACAERLNKDEAP